MSLTLFIIRVLALLLYSRASGSRGNGGGSGSGCGSGGSSSGDTQATCKVGSPVYFGDVAVMVVAMAVGEMPVQMPNAASARHARINRKPYRVPG